MRITCLSDTHGDHNLIGAVKWNGKLSYPALPEGDVLVHAGDTTARGLYTETLAFINWMGDQPFKHKVLIAGNHDATFESNEFEMREYCLAAGINYLRDSQCIINGVKFYGSPYTPPFYDWHFMEDESKLYERWSRIPFNTDVLITHGPPEGILDTRNSDYSEYPENTGSTSLRRAILGPRLNLKAHIFGHIHESRGETYEYGTFFVNASFLNRDYLPFGKVQPTIDI